MPDPSYKCFVSSAARNGNRAPESNPSPYRTSRGFHRRTFLGLNLPAGSTLRAFPSRSSLLKSPGTVVRKRQPPIEPQVRSAMGWLVIAALPVVFSLLWLLYVLWRPDD